MNNKGKKYEKLLHLDMRFDEAIGRFAQTDTKELPDNIKLKPKEKAGATKTPAPPVGKKSEEPSSRKSQQDCSDK